MEDEFKLRCRRCRCLVVTDHQLINTHSEPLGTSDTSTLCSSKSTSSVWYVAMETDLFPWIQEAVTQASWTKGKLYCPKCNGRIGSFDFINSSQCPCGRETLPGVHILCNRVDKINISKSSQLVHQSSSHLVLNGRLQFIGRVGSTKNRQLPSLQDCSSISTIEVASSSGGKSTDEAYLSQGGRNLSRTLDVTSNSTNTFDSLPNIPSVINKADCDIVPVKEEITPLTYRNIPHSALLVTKDLKTSTDIQCDVKTFGTNKSETNSGVSMAANEAPIIMRQRQRLRKEHRRRQRLQKGGDEFGLIWDRELREEVNRFHLLVEENQDQTPETDPLEEIEDDHVCPVCLDVYLHPHVCVPCDHMFCESCLRQLAQKSDNSTRFYCPMCRKLIINCEPRQELSEELKTLYPLTYEYRLVTDRKFLAHRFRLPRSVGVSRPPSSMHSQFMWAVSRSHWGLVYMAKHVTLAASIVLLILVLCVSMVL